MDRQKFVVFAVAAAIVVCGIAGFLFLNRGSHIELKGSVLKVRTHPMEGDNTLVVVDFRFSNTSDYPFVVKEVTATLEGKDGSKTTGTILAEMDATRFMDYYKELGPKYNESLRMKSKIPGGQTADRMIAATFNLPAPKVEDRKRIVLKIDDVDGPVSEVAEAAR